ncbi:MAG: hypothetical protein EOO14_22115, partial [Chitinophagaceae bacterium]
MKKLIGFSLFILLAAGSYAQDSTAKTPNRTERKQNERARRSAMSRQQEEGVLVFNKHTAFGAQVRTNGYGLFLELGRSRSPRFTNLYLLEITEIKHPKEERVNNANAFFSNSFIYG